MGTSVLYPEFEGVNEFSNGQSPSLPPSILNTDEIYQQIVTIGRGQKFRLNAQIAYPIRLTIIRFEFTTKFNHNYLNNVTIFNQEVERANFEFIFNNYTVLFIIWNNSRNNPISDDNHILFHQSITNLDLDLVDTSILFFITGIVIESIKVSVNISKRYHYQRFIKYSHSNPIQGIYGLKSSRENAEAHSNERKNEFLENIRIFLLVLKNEFRESVKYLPVIILLLSYIIFNPNEHILLLKSSRHDLTVSLLQIWTGYFELIQIFWIVIIGLIGIRIFRVKLETNELRADFSYPIKRKYFALISLMKSFFLTVLALLIPFSASIVLNYKRFKFFPYFEQSLLVLLWFCLLILTLLIIGAITGLLFPYKSVYYSIVIYVVSLFSLVGIASTLFSGIILSLPDGLKKIYSRTAMENSLTPDWYSLVVFSAILLAFLFFLYFFKIRTLEVE